MSQHYRSDGRVVPVTIVKVSPCTVTDVRTLKRDGYEAIQLGSGKAKHASKALTGHLKGKLFANVREFRARKGQTLPTMNVGDELSAGQFEAGEKVNVTGISKGRGFQGVVKRHGFHGSPKTHGHKDQVRMPGSIGATQPQHVLKGTRMGGHMGSAKSTMKHLEVIAIDVEKGELMLKGAVPGAPRSLVLIQTA